jgi:hypothetical protein
MLAKVTRYILHSFGRFDILQASTLAKCRGSTVHKTEWTIRIDFHAALLLRHVACSVALVSCNNNTIPEYGIENSPQKQQTEDCMKALRKEAKKHLFGELRRHKISSTVCRQCCG